MPPLFHMTSSIIKATMDTPTALNTLSKSLSANLAASIHPHQAHKPKPAQPKNTRLADRLPTREVPVPPKSPMRP